VLEGGDVVVVVVVTGAWLPPLLHPAATVPTRVRATTAAIARRSVGLELIARVLSYAVTLGSEVLTPAMAVNARWFCRCGRGQDLGSERVAPIRGDSLFCRRDWHR
jgi:hypothetical protein